MFDRDVPSSFISYSSCAEEIKELKELERIYDCQHFVSL